jgi:hypothetical protein
MIRTFKKLKLKGDIGRFGVVELSGINAFIGLDYNKVLSSSMATYCFENAA